MQPKVGAILEGLHSTMSTSFPSNIDMMLTKQWTCDDGNVICLNITFY